MNYNSICRNDGYIRDIKNIAAKDLPWGRLAGKAVVISGASGMIGSFLIDVLMFINEVLNLRCNVYAIVRNESRAKQRFDRYLGRVDFNIICHDINKTVDPDVIPKADLIFHLASNTHPVAYATEPVGTIMTNVLGTDNLLKLAAKNEGARFVFASSNEVYGENRGDQEKFDESYCGYIDPNTLRAGYPESKRCGEALCQAYRKQYGVDAVIARLTRSYGPTMLDTDTKAISQFIKNALNGEDIVLKSEGRQLYSYTYVADAVYGLLTVALKGDDGEAYNIADESSDISLRDLAQIMADWAGREVIFQLPDDIERAGYSAATKARLDGGKIEDLGWRPSYDIKNGVEHTLEMLRDSET